MFIKTFKEKIKSLYIDTSNNIILDISYTNMCFILYLLKTISFFKYDTLLNIHCVDTMNIKNRYFLYYNLISTKYNQRLIIKMGIPNKMIVNSATQIYSSANWLEREIWDFFGIFFYNHKDLRRILTDYGFDGFPLRKNFPVAGFFEVMYDIDVKSVVYTFLETSQELRFYNFKSPWEKSSF